jgi:hypothetical protein
MLPANGFVARTFQPLTVPSELGRRDDWHQAEAVALVDLVELDPPTLSGPSSGSFSMTGWGRSQG